MSVKNMTPAHKEAMKAGREAYWAKRKADKAGSTVGTPTPAQIVTAVETKPAKRHYTKRAKPEVTPVTTTAVTVHKSSAKRGRPPMVKVETFVKKPYTFATVTANVHGKPVTEIGFAKWDNVAPEWDEQFGKNVAIGRAKKEFKRKHGIRV